MRSGAGRRRDRTVTIAGPDGAPVHLHDLGGDGPTILFAHATGFHGLIWKSVAEHLTRRYRCWALDFRGHGDSPVPHGDDLAWEGFGRDVSAALDAITEEPAIGVGHSLGGAALVMAQIARPGSFAHLFLYEPALAADGAPQRAALLGQDAMVKMAAARRAEYPSVCDAMFSYARKAPMSTFQAAALAAYVEHGFVTAGGGVRLKCHPSTEAQVYARSYDHDTTAHLDRLSCPVTVAVGALSTPMHQSATRALAERTRAGVYELDGVDHFGPMQQPRTLAMLIDRAVQSGQT